MGEDEGDEDGFGNAGEFEAEEWGGFGEAGFAVGSHGELDVDDRADGDISVEQSAADEVADVVGVWIEGGEIFCGDHDLLAGEEFGLGDGVAAGQFEDDAAGVFAEGEPMGFEGDRGSVGHHSSRFGEGDKASRAKLGVQFEVGEEVGEEFALASLGTQEVGNGHPAGYRWIKHCDPGISPKGKLTPKGTLGGKS